MFTTAIISRSYSKIFIWPSVGMWEWEYNIGCGNKINPHLLTVDCAKTLLSSQRHYQVTKTKGTETSVKTEIQLLFDTAQIPVL